MNGLKACSSWSLYVARYDMTNMLVTSNNDMWENEKKRFSGVAEAEVF